MRPFKCKPLNFSLRFVFRLMTNIALALAFFSVVKNAAPKQQEVVLWFAFYGTINAIIFSFYLTKDWLLECVTYGATGLGLPATVSDQHVFGEFADPLVPAVLTSLLSLVLLSLILFLVRRRAKQVAKANRLAAMINPFSPLVPEPSQANTRPK